MIRKSGVVLLGLLVGLFLLVASWPYLSYEMDDSPGVVSGNSVKDAVATFYEMSSINQRIFILSQVVLLIVIVIAVFFIVKRFRKKETLFKQDYVATEGAKRSRTDLDVLYEMLKKKKEISLEDVERVFKVSSEVALGWSKVFENGDLAEVDYPRFGKPVLRLLEEEKVEESEEKKDEVKVEEGKIAGKVKVAGKKSGVLAKKVLPLKKKDVKVKKIVENKKVVGKKKVGKKKVGKKKR